MPQGKYLHHGTSLREGKGERRKQGEGVVER
jgi:hypothetical protein